MNDNETVDDVLADMLLPRFDAITAMRANNYDEIKSLIANYRDRIEAAYKRELSKICPKTGGDFGQLGDVAKLREALETIRKRLVAPYESEAGFMRYSPNRPLVDLIDAALAAPPRNCEVGTAEEQAERFILFCLRNSFRGVCNDSCKFANVNRRLGWQEIGQARCFPFWAQMPYEEGGDK